MYKYRFVYIFRIGKRQCRQRNAPRTPEERAVKASVSARTGDAALPIAIK